MSDQDNNLKALAVLLRDTAVCETDRPSDAVAVLLQAAGDILFRTLGEDLTLATLRGIVERTEASVISARQSASASVQ